MKKNTYTLLQAGREVCLEVYTKKIKYMVMHHHQNAGQNLNLLVANTSCENVLKFKYLETTVTNLNCIHEEITGRLNSGDACYNSIPSHLSSCLLSLSKKKETLRLEYQ
jgi:hypothetical protein